MERIPSGDLKIHKYYMGLALQEAEQVIQDIPVAALIVKDGQVIAISANQKELTNDPTAHAEVVVIRKAAKLLNKWRLDNTILYTTLEPCPMCAAAILYSRIPRVVFGAYDSLYGALGSVINLPEVTGIYYPEIIGGIEEERAGNLIRKFFETYRKS